MKIARAAALILILSSLALDSLASLHAEKILLINGSVVDDSEILRVFRQGNEGRYDHAGVRKSLRYIAAMPGVADVGLERKTEGEEVIMRLTVTPEPLVRSIGIRGVTVFDAGRLEAELITRVDEPVVRSKIDEDISVLLNRYADRGYKNATCRADVNVVSKGRFADVNLIVDEGKPVRIDEYGDLGDARVIGEENFLKVLKLEKGSAASEEDLREKLQGLLEYCYDRGYPEARVNDPGFVFTETGAKLNAPLVLGRKWKMEIDGLPVWERVEYMKLLRKEFGQPLDQERINRLGSVIRDDLVEKGFMKATVSPLVTEEGDAGFVKFVVKKDIFVMLKHVKFEGNTALSSKELLNVMESVKGTIFGSEPFNINKLEADLSRILQVYVTIGMLDTGVTLEGLEVPRNGRATAAIKITEGLRYSYRSITFKTDGALTPEEALAISGLISGRNANPALLEKARINLLAELSRRGHIDAKIERETFFDKKTGDVDVIFTIEGGPAKVFGTVLVSGNPRTSSKVILRELTFKTGEPWSRQEVIQSRQNIFRLGFFEQVDIRPLGEAGPDGALDVMVTVRETDAGRLDYGIGYGTEENIKTFVEVGHSNLFGGGRGASARVDLTGQDRTLTINYLEPWILGFPFDLKMNLIIQHSETDAYTVNSTALQSSVEYEFTKYLKGSLIHTLESDRLSDITENDFTGDKKYVASTLSPILLYDSRDDIFNPRKGYQGSVQYEFSSRALGSDLEYSKLTASAGGYYSLGKFTLGLMARGGAAEYYGRNETLPLNKRFFLGGRSTVRGFAKDEIGPKAEDGTPLGGDLMLNLKAELRAALFGAFGVAAFWDAGQVWLQDKETPDLADLRQSVGPSVRYNTPVGPLSLDVGYKLDREPGETSYEWHFTIGNVF